MVEVEVPFERRLDEQPGPGPPARTMIVFVVGAKHDVVEGEGAPEQVVHAVQFAPVLISAGKAGLVGGGDENESGTLQFLQTGFRSFHDLELLEGQRSYRLLRSRANLIQDRIPF